MKLFATVDGTLVFCPLKASIIVIATADCIANSRRRFSLSIINFTTFHGDYNTEELMWIRPLRPKRPTTKLLLTKQAKKIPLKVILLEATFAVLAFLIATLLFVFEE